MRRRKARGAIRIRTRLLGPCRRPKLMAAPLPLLPSLTIGHLTQLGACRSSPLAQYLRAPAAGARSAAMRPSYVAMPSARAARLDGLQPRALPAGGGDADAWPG